VEQPKRVEAEKEAGGQTAERRRRSGWRGGKRQKKMQKAKEERKGSNDPAPIKAISQENPS